MASSLIDVAKGYLTSEVVNRISGALGESPDRMHRAIDAGIPSILAGFVKNASSSGLGRMFDMLKQDPPELNQTGGLDGILGNLGGLLTGGSAESLIKFGQSALGALFGGKLSSIVDLIARTSGIKPESVSSLLGMLAPLLMGVIRKEASTHGFSPSSLANLLTSQADSIAKLAPAGLASALGLNSLADLGSAADSIKSAGAGAAREIGHAAEAAANPLLRWAVPLALLALIALGLMYMYNRTEVPPQNRAQEPDLARLSEKISNPVRNAVNTAGKAVRDAGGSAAATLTKDGKVLIETASKMVPLTLPGNVSLEVPENSYLQKVVTYLTDGTRSEPGTFVADNVSFEGSTSKLAADSTAAVTRLATVLKAFSKAKLKVEGHSDKTGSPDENKKDALERATSVKDALVQAGVPADRITAEGVSSTRPTGANDTDIARAINRRIEFSITAQ
jgi:outer membrane protein OmpA-like peptidoglycan-associated protein